MVATLRQYYARAVLVWGAILTILKYASFVLTALVLGWYGWTIFAPTHAQVYTGESLVDGMIYSNRGEDYTAAKILIAFARYTDYDVAYQEEASGRMGMFALHQDIIVGVCKQAIPAYMDSASAQVHCASKWYNLVRGGGLINTTILRFLYAKPTEVVVHRDAKRNGSLAGARRLATLGLVVNCDTTKCSPEQMRAYRVYELYSGM